MSTLPSSHFSSGLLSHARFSSALQRGTLSLLTIQVNIDNRINTHLLHTLTRALRVIGVEYCINRLNKEKTIHIEQRDISYEQYTERHKQYTQRQQNTDDTQTQTQTQNESEREMDTAFMMIEGEMFLQAMSESDCELFMPHSPIVHLHTIVWCLPSHVMSSVCSFSTQCWLSSGACSHIHFTLSSVEDATTFFLNCLRAMSTADHKVQSDSQHFQFGSIRVNKGRTAAMRGAIPSPSPNNLSVSLSESWLHFLSLIRGVSEGKALRIAAVFPSFQSLLTAYQQHEQQTDRDTDTDRGELLLADIQCGHKRLGKTLSARIYHAMIGA